MRAHKLCTKNLPLTLLTKCVSILVRNSWMKSPSPMPVRNDYRVTVLTILALPCSLEIHSEKPSTVSTTSDVKRNQTEMNLTLQKSTSKKTQSWYCI